MISLEDKMKSADTGVWVYTRATKKTIIDTHAKLKIPFELTIKPAEPSKHCIETREVGSYFRFEK